MYFINRLSPFDQLSFHIKMKPGGFYIVKDIDERGAFAPLGITDYAIIGDKEPFFGGWGSPYSESQLMTLTVND